MTTLRRVTRGQHLYQEIINTIYPPSCLQCFAPIAENGGFCGACWKSFVFVAAPLCQRCHAPLTPWNLIKDGTLQTCGECFRDWRWIDTFFSPLVYQPPFAGNIVRFKNRLDLEMARCFHLMLLGSLLRYSSKIDLVVPVPLHRTKFLKRRYNQAAEIIHPPHAQHRQRGFDWTITTNFTLLQRHHAGTQKGLGRHGRFANLANAFVVPRSYHRMVKNKTVLIVDDVVTTGATMNACARALKQAGAREVHGWSVARALKQGEQRNATD